MSEHFVLNTGPQRGALCGSTLTYTGVFAWMFRDRVRCVRCRLLIAVAEANGLTPENFRVKLPRFTEASLISFRGAVEYILEQSQ